MNLILRTLLNVGNINKAHIWSQDNAFKIILESVKFPFLRNGQKNHWSDLWVCVCWHDSFSGKEMWDGGCPPSSLCILHYWVWLSPVSRLSEDIRMTSCDKQYRWINKQAVRLCCVCSPVDHWSGVHRTSCLIWELSESNRQLLSHCMENNIVFVKRRCRTCTLPRWNPKWHVYIRSEFLFLHSWHQLPPVRNWTILPLNVLSH